MATVNSIKDAAAQLGITEAAFQQKMLGKQYYCISIIGTVYTIINNGEDKIKSYTVRNVLTA